MSSTSLHQKYSNYHYCIVRECKNTSVKTPGKLWIKVPNEMNMRNTWLKLAKRDPDSFSTQSLLYLCEDHFDLENDMENYRQYKIMGSVKRIRMKPNCIPSRFDCQTDRKRKFCLTSDELGMQQHASKRTAVVPVPEDIQICSTAMSTSSFHQELLGAEDAIPSCSREKEFHDKAVQAVQHNIKFRDQAIQVQPVHEHVSCQVVIHHAHKASQACVTKHYRSKRVQFSAAVKDAVSSPIRLIAHQSTSTSPNKPSVSGYTATKRKLIFAEEKYESDVSYSISQGGSSYDTSPSKPSSQTTEGSLQENIIKEQKLNLQSSLSKIKKNPRMYIGIPAELYFIVDIISKHTKVSENHVVLCLMKIRLNRTFSQLADDFDISLSQASKIFYSKLPLIVNVLLPFVKTFTKSTIKKNLPIAFRHKYNMVNCIIDCLEIEIQKLKKAIHQALTWSEYKRANTFKYLISCTPDGLVSFVSNGYGGRISDINLLEHCKFLDSLEPGSSILADRGFKHIEMYLNQRGFTLLRPPSVAVGSKLTKKESKQTKQIASLRIHVERVIRRIREFAILKPHSVVKFESITCTRSLCTHSLFPNKFTGLSY